MDHDTRDQMIRALKSLRDAADDANAVVEDMLKPPRMRQLGHVLQRDNYSEARGKLVASHAFLMRCMLTEPSDPAGSGGAGPAL